MLNQVTRALARGGVTALVLALSIGAVVGGPHARANAKLNAFDRQGHLLWSARVGSNRQQLSVLGVRRNVVVAQLANCDDEDPQASPVVVAFDTRNGRRIWRAPDPDGWAGALGFQSLVLTQDGLTIRALDPMTGRALWSHDGDALAAGGDLVLVHESAAASQDPRSLEIAALAVRTGEQRWSASVSNAANGMGFVDATSVVIGPSALSNVVTVLDADSGAQRYAFDSPFVSRARPTGPHVVVSNDSSDLFTTSGLDALSGAEEWTIHDARAILNAPTPPQDVYVQLTGANRDSGYGLANIDTATGAVRWQRSSQPGELVAASAHLSVFADRASSRLSALDARTGVRLWQAQLEQLVASAAIGPRQDIYVASGCSRGAD